MEDRPTTSCFLKGFIKPDMLIWTDDAVWENDTTTCHFNIITNYQVEDIRCVGTIKFEGTPKGKSTKIVYSGTLTIRKTARSSMFMTGFIIKGIEAVASHLIEQNFDKVVKTLTETIKEEK